MTIEYKDSKRIVALSSDILNTPTFEDDFTSDNWVDTGSNIEVNTSTDVIDWNGGQSNVNNGTSYDLTTVSDTAWVLRYKMVVDNLTQGGDSTPDNLMIGISASPSSTTASTSQNNIGVKFNVASGSKSIATVAGTGNTFTPIDTFTTTITSTTYYTEIKRNSSTSMTVSLYSDSDYSTLIESKTSTISGSPTGLQYLKVQSRDNLDGTDNHTFDGTIDDVEFYNGVSSLTNKPTDVQDNSILVEKDTAKRYWFDEATTPTTTFDYSNTTGWTFTNSAITNTGGECVMTSGNASNDVRGYKSLGTTLSDTVWTADFEFEHSDETPRAAGMPFCITAGTGIPASATQDMLGVKTFTSSNVIFPMYKDGSGSVTTGSTITLTFGTKYYCRLSRTTATNLELKVFSDSSRSTQVGSTINLTIPSTITTLTTLQHAISPGSSGDKMNFKIDNTKIYNGTTSVTPATWTMNPTIEDDLTTNNGWVFPTNSSYDSTNDQIDLTIASSSFDVSYIDLQKAVYFGSGNNLDDDKFIIRARITKNTDLSDTSKGSSLLLQISSALTDSSKSPNPQDAVGIRIDTNRTGGTSVNKFFVHSADNGTFWTGESSGISYDWGTGDLYWEIIGDGTNVTGELFTGSDYSTGSLGKATTSQQSPTGMRYLKFCGFNDPSRTANQFSLQDFKIYNGVTSIN